MSEAAQALAASRRRLADARRELQTHEVEVFAPLRAKIERNHFADKLRAVIS